MPPLLADFTHARPCKPFCEKYLTLPFIAHGMKNTPAIVTAVRKTKNIPKRDVLLLYFLFINCTSDSNQSDLIGKSNWHNLLLYFL